MAVTETPPTKLDRVERIIGQKKTGKNGHEASGQSEGAQECPDEWTGCAPGAGRERAVHSRPSRDGIPLRTVNKLLWLIRSNSIVPATQIGSRGARELKVILRQCGGDPRRWSDSGYTGLMTSRSRSDCTQPPYVSPCSI